MKKTKSIHILGTGSGVGKSIINAGICRILKQDGHHVAPFKAQNMALNSYVTQEGHEIGRAQATQALACEISPSSLMNPVLLKPNSDTGSQVILNGLPLKSMNAKEYYDLKPLIKQSVHEAHQKLSERYDVIVMEGAGSPAEINLKKNDIVNLHMAKFAKAPVILVGDIDKGVVFAWIVGTLELMTQTERKMVKGFIINKFRGDISLLQSGLRFLEKKTGIPVLGVIPYFKDIDIPEEDSVYLSKTLKRKSNHSKKSIKINVIRLPHISNFTDFDPLEKENDVDLRYIHSHKEWRKADLIIIPGSKNTIGDMKYLHESGLSQTIIQSHEKFKTHVLGICGGYQMIGELIEDKHSIENQSSSIKGLGLLPIITNYNQKKTLSQVKALHLETDIQIEGYEIHHGTTKHLTPLDPLFKIIKKSNKQIDLSDGAMNKEKTVMGTYIHGLFDNDHLRLSFLNHFRQLKQYSLKKQTTVFNVSQELDKLADLLRTHLDMENFYQILN